MPLKQAINDRAQNVRKTPKNANGVTIGVTIGVTKKRIKNAKICADIL